MIGLKGADLEGFSGLVQLLPESSGYLAQRQLLEKDFGAYLPDNDKEAPLKLKELVTRKATSEHADNPAIRREDVLAAIDSRPDLLFPAPLLIDLPEKIVERVQMPALIEKIIATPGAAILVADGGVGKSVVATRIGSWLPTGSATFVYDCFGNGAYRGASGYRHRARDGLVQLSNEMATASLCDLLIPTSKSDGAAYIRAFMARLVQASAVVSARAPSALLSIIIDAADNAQMAADDNQDGQSFPRLLLLEKFPSNVRIVCTSRPHRVHLLNPGPDIPRIELAPFSEEETSANLRGYFSDASIQDVREFHRLTSQNPRVQKFAIDAESTISGVLSALGPTPVSVDDTIGALLERAVKRVRHEAAKIEQPQIDRLCEALATLRPFVPLEVVARAADVPVDLVRSISHDLGRPLLIREDAVQFRDEPTETWFRERFRPSCAALDDFVARLKPLASISAYVAAVLPQLMLEAGQFDSLVSLALSGEALPADGAVSRRDIELQRLQFAIKAALRSKRFPDAARLALKAGGEAAADARQQNLLSSNTDLAARFLDENQIVDQVSRRLIVGGNWTGSEHAYEAALLSGKRALEGDARARLRFSYDWIGHWARRQKTEDGKGGRIEDADIAELLLAELNLHGPVSCASQLSRWRPREVSFRVGEILVGRLVDAGRFDEIDALAVAAGNDLGLVLAAAVKLREVDRVPPIDAVKRALALALNRRITIKAPEDWRGDDVRLGAVTALVLAALRHRRGAKRALAGLLKRYLPKEPPHSLYSEHSYGGRSVHLRAYTLMAALKGTPLVLEKLVPSKLRKAFDSTQNHDPDVRRLRETVGALLPWHVLSVNAKLGRTLNTDLHANIEEARKASEKAEGQYHQERSNIADEVALIWCELIFGSDDPDLFWPTFTAWLAKLKHPLFTSTLAAIAHRSGRKIGQKAQTLAFAVQAFNVTDIEKDHAENKAQSYMTLARAVLLASEADAQQYFEEAILVSSRIGEENLSRWHALLNLADSSAGENRDDPITAYRFARAAELTYKYVDRDKHFDWQHTVKSLVGLSPRSAPTIMSRWVDRQFGHEARLLAYLFTELREQGHIDARDALAFIPFKAWWEYTPILEAALSKTDDANARREVAEFSFRYLQFESMSLDDWKQIHDLLARHKIDGIDTESMLSVEKAKNEAKTVVSASETALARETYSSSAEPVDWDAIFSNSDVSISSSLLAVLERYSPHRHGYQGEDFFEQAFKRVAVGRERAFLEAYSACGTPGLFELRELLKALPANWASRVSVRPALARLAKEVFRRDAESVSAGDGYNILPYEQVTKATGLSSIELIGEAVEALGSTSLPASANGLFRLVGLLAQLVSMDAGLDSLKYGLDLLEPVFEAVDGDGPWISVLMPPPSTGTAIVGYLWAALASPSATRRWQAAHTVRALCSLGRVEALSSLISFARNRSGGPFSDSQFRFYELHAVQWLVIALARAAKEDGEMVARHANFLRIHGSRMNRHVIVRDFAAGALLSLHEQGLVPMSTREHDELRAINQSLLPTVSRKDGFRKGEKRKERRYEDKRFHFGYDFDKESLAPLARCFSLGNGAVEQEAENVIRDDWALDDNGHWDRDARAARGFFREDLRRSGRNGAHNDNLNAYLSYHSLMIVAGKLLDTRRLDKVRGDDWNSFSRWISRQCLTRADGVWCFDRRDRQPPDCQVLPATLDADWSSSLKREYLSRLLSSRADAIVVAGWWTQCDGRREQRVRVGSALVTSDKLPALVRALVSTVNPHDYRLPEYGDDAEIDQGLFSFKGWIEEVELEAGIDEFDPWAADMRSRAFELSKPFESLLNLQSDALKRTWRDAKGRAMIWSESWSDEQLDEERPSAEGHRLVASRLLLDNLMGANGQALLFEMNVERRLISDRYGRDSGKVSDNGAEITTIFTLESQGEVSEFQRNTRTRRRNRRRAGSR